MRNLAMALAAILALCAGPVRSQSTTRAEFLVLDQDGNPLPDVAVALDYRGHVVQRYRGNTNKRGRFTYLNVYAGPYTVTLSKTGYGEAKLESFTITDRGEFQGPVELRIKRKTAPVAAGSEENGDALEAARSAIGHQVAEAMKLVEDGRFDEAEFAYLKLASANPGFADVHYNLGFLYKRKAERAKAEACFRRAVECDPRLAEAYNALAVLLVESGRAAEAVATLERGVAENQANVVLQYSLGMMYVAESMAELARPAFLKVLDLEPGNAEAQFQLASLAVASNSIPEAVERLQEYLATAPEGAANAATARALLQALRRSSR